MQRRLYSLSIILLLAACQSSPPSGRYALDDDVAPEQTPTVIHLDDAQPRYEPYSLAGNRDYTLRGESYTIIQDSAEFSEEGLASWYGKKFHGHLTSNGEVYDMYSMTAAHKTLPLPSYVTVTNLDNGHSVIVRVNDRGPFHEGRVIDLSYAAAKKIGVIKTGTAPVRVEIITVDKPSDDEIHTLHQYDYYVQLAAVNDPTISLAQAAPIAEQFATEALSINDETSNLTRVRLGPITNKALAKQVKDAAIANGFSAAYIITSSHQREVIDGVTSSAAMTSQFTPQHKPTLTDE
ncbi:septal ring lytic transglycosylase RlpA family protein [Thaumasiovibrio sp. DFM-14]|uniref:septal ring lytic transglycosylase RlpA family protein n=1 Tax=Thaumasiovibrio sp. DFM-14 TaxID=3384792 RepID=UPI0039A1F57B